MSNEKEIALTLTLKFSTDDGEEFPEGCTAENLIDQLERVLEYERQDGNFVPDEFFEGLSCDWVTVS